MRNIALFKKDGIEDTKIVEETFLKEGFIISKKINSDTDLIISLGGDGTMLRSIHTASEKDVPVLGLNFGNLGFLTSDIHKDMNKLIVALKNEDFRIQKRIMLDVCGFKEGKCVFTKAVVNEMAIKSINISRLTELNVYIEDCFISKYRADGVIVATPTGSTAYSLSAGGPVVEPELSLGIITPICSHSLTQRSLIYDSRKQVVVRPMMNDQLLVSLDGQANHKISPDTEIRVRKSKKTAQIVKFDDEIFFDVIRQKLSWGEE